MIFENNISGFSIFIFTIISTILYVKKNSLGSFAIAGWAGLFVFSIPIFLNKFRKVYYYPYEEFHLLQPNLESKFIYFLFWLGFVTVLFFFKNYEKPDNNLYIKNKTLDIFSNVCFVNTVFFLIYQYYSNDIELISLVGKWLFLFLLVALLMRKKNFQAFFLVLIIVFYGFILLDRTLSVISAFILVAFKLNELKSNKNKNFLYLLKIFIFVIFTVFCLVIIITYTKLFGKLIVGSQEYSLNVLFDVFNDLQKSFEPLLIYGHTMFALEGFKDFESMKYLISIISNLTIYPSFFDLSTNYYTSSLMDHFQDISFGLAGSIYASTYLAFGYFGLFVTGCLYGLFLCYADYRLEFYKNTFTVLIGVSATITAIYLHRNGLDNFLSIFRQLIILYFWLKIQTSFICIITKKDAF